MDPVSEGAEFLERRGRCFARRREERPRSDVAGTRRKSLATPQLEREGEEELLRAIVQVPLETASFRLASLDDPSA